MGRRGCLRRLEKRAEGQRQEDQVAEHQGLARPEPIVLRELPGDFRHDVAGTVFGTTASRPLGHRSRHRQVPQATNLPIGQLPKEIHPVEFRGDEVAHQQAEQVVSIVGNGDADPKFRLPMVEGKGQHQHAYLAAVAEVPEMMDAEAVVLEGVV